MNEIKKYRIENIKLILSKEKINKKEISLLSDIEKMLSSSNKFSIDFLKLHGYYVDANDEKIKGFTLKDLWIHQNIKNKISIHINLLNKNNKEIKIYYGDNKYQDFYESEDHKILIFKNKGDNWWQFFFNQNYTSIASLELDDTIKKVKTFLNGNVKIDFSKVYVGKCGKMKLANV